MAEQSENVKTFAAELIELCKKHKIYLTPSAYDALQAWDLAPGDKFDVISLMEDKTCSTENNT